MAMTTLPDEEPFAPEQKTQSVSPQPDPTATAVPPERSRQTVVTLPGEIDITNDGHVQDTLTCALDDGTAVLIADATRTSFCDCSGVHVLLRIHHKAAAAGAQLRVVASPAMRRILKLTGADRVLDTYPALAAAQAGWIRPLAQPPSANSALPPQRARPHQFPLNDAAIEEAAASLAALWEGPIPDDGLRIIHQGATLLAQQRQHDLARILEKMTPADRAALLAGLTHFQEAAHRQRHT